VEGVLAAAALTTSAHFLSFPDHVPYVIFMHVDESCWLAVGKEGLGHVQVVEIGEQQQQYIVVHGGKPKP
jgi:hypothetical protein